MFTVEKKNKKKMDENKIEMKEKENLSLIF